MPVLLGLDLNWYPVITISDVYTYRAGTSQDHPENHDRNYRDIRDINSPYQVESLRLNNMKRIGAKQ